MHPLLHRPLLLVLVVSVSGCFGADDAPSTAPPEADEITAPVWTPHPKGPVEPALGPGSDFVETEWGYVRSDWTPPATIEPSIFYMEGYNGASSPLPTHYLRLRDGTLLALSILAHDQKTPVDSSMPNFPGFTQVRASMRGTGCSAGSFTLFSPESAMDGREAIEWIAAQTWTTPDVGMYGASYSGLTAFYVAATQPPHLAAVVPNLIIEDYYRGIAYPGGISNSVFPVAWPFLRQQLDSEAAIDGISAGDEICAHNQATHRPGHPGDTVIATLLSRPFDDGWYQAFALRAHAAAIRAPISMAQSWQDEQTGPRGGSYLFGLVSPDPVDVDGRTVVPKRLVATNGGHADAAATAYWSDKRWFDFFLKHEPNGVLDEAPVQIHVFTERRATDDAANYTWDDYSFEIVSERLDVDSFPPQSANWTRMFLRSGGALSYEAPEGSESADTYLSGSPRRAWAWGPDVEGNRVPDQDLRADGPDVIAWRSEPLQEAVAVAGPIAATLHLATTAPDTDLFVAVADEYPDGTLVYLQRGLLRASHRALDLERTLYTEAGDVLLPHHPHTAMQPVPANAVLPYEIEVFPVAHLFLPGHRIHVEISTPPLVDGLWGYSPLRLPGINSVYHDAEHPSSLLLPIVPWPGKLPPEAQCGVVQQYHCTPAADPMMEDLLP